MFPSKKIQQLQSYKDFQTYISKYATHQISFLKKGRKTEKPDTAYHVSYIVFEDLPFSFQIGVFREYIVSQGFEFNITNDEEEMKKTINFFFDSL